MKHRSYIFGLLAILFVFLLPSLSHALYTFPTKIDTKAERINIQTVLNTVMIPSPNLKVDGVLGKKSIQAIQSFQESKGLVPDGKVGPITRSTLESAQRGSTSTSYTPPITTTSGCLPGAIFNTLNGQRCNSTSSSLTGCNGTNKFNTITGALCTNTTTSVTGGGGGGGGGSSTTIIPACTGSSTQSCTITNGQGNQSRVCNSGNWSSYSSCSVISCNSGYQEVNNACASTTCTGLSTQPCTIANGTGNQSRTCTLGAWSSYGSCSPISCNSGYSINGNTCIATPDTTKPTITSFTIPSTSSSLSVPITTLTAGDDKGVTGFLLNESSSTPNASSGSWTSIPSTIYTFLSQGLKTLYAWAKDAAGNVSNSLSRQTTITTSSNWQTGLISWWKLDGNTNDSQGSNNGTNSGATLTNTNCKSGSCYSFDGVNDTINFPDTSTLQMDVSDFTMNTWVYINNYPTQGDYSILIGGEINSANMKIDDTGHLRLATYGFDDGVPSTFIIGKSGWHMVTIVFDSTATTNNLTYYLDGGQASTKTYNRNFYYGASSNNLGGTTGEPYEGKLDEVMIWKRKLNSTEIQDVYNLSGSNPPPVCVPESSSTTCLNKCGSQTNNCGESVSCTACVVNPPTNSSIDIIYSNNFEQNTLGDYLSSEAFRDWNHGPYPYVKKGHTYIDQNTNDSSNTSKYLRVFHKKGTYGGTVPYEDSGTELYQYLTQGYDELYFSYKIKVQEGFESQVTKGKIPSMEGYLKVTYAGQCVHGDDGFYGSLQFGPMSGGIGITPFIYHVDMWKNSFNPYMNYEQFGSTCDEVYAKLKDNPGYGGVYGSGGAIVGPLPTGGWHTFTERIVMNTLGQNNGIVELFLDGQLYSQRTDYTFKTVEALKINMLSLVSFFGGGAESAVREDMNFYFDDFVAYKFKPGYGQPVGNTPSASNRILPTINF